MLIFRGVGLEFSRFGQRLGKGVSHFNNRSELALVLLAKWWFFGVLSGGR